MTWMGFQFIFSGSLLNYCVNSLFEFANFVPNFSKFAMLISIYELVVR